jgi:hypothetical protein
MRARWLLRLRGAAYLSLLYTIPSQAQVPYPEHVVQNMNWSSGVHNVQVSNRIIAPGDGGGDVLITGTAQAEFVSGTSIHLTDGFHAGGFTGAGQHFRARIDPMNSGPDDVIAIAPDPAMSVIDNVLHVPKWEKVEIGVRLPLEYQDAIDRFFAHYYSNGENELATPNMVDAAHDLNPYADDSLQLVMHITKPGGGQTLKFGFFMKEGEWMNSDLDNGLLTAALNSPTFPYHVRFRLAPDEEGLWSYTLTIKAPGTSSLGGALLPDLTYTGYTFHCSSPLPDNFGPLSVNPNNNRVLWFNEVFPPRPFLGMGVNMNATHSASNWQPSVDGWKDPDMYRITRHFFEETISGLEQLSASGGNFSRIFLGDKDFGPETSNLGVYDAYRTALSCNGNGPNEHPRVISNGQYQCWAFDQVLDAARENGIYLQVCIDPYPPIIAYETWGWGYNAYLNGYVKPRNPVTGNYDMKKFFYTNGQLNSGVFYYWKRKYKYIMARWGYSVNMPIIEPFNEADQMLTYSYRDFRNQDDALCAESKIEWFADPNLPLTMDQWLTDITGFVRGSVNLGNPASSPLGESKKLFLLSFTDGQPAGSNVPNYFKPFENEHVDLLDVHRGLNTNGADPLLNIGVGLLQSSFNESSAYRNTYLSNGSPKPFNRGEHSYFQNVDADLNTTNGAEFDSEKIFDNYDASFHNELWAAAFYGNFATGTTWNKERVFWWENGLITPPYDPLNGIPQPPFSKAKNHEHIINIGTTQIPIPIEVKNTPIHHHFRPLVDMLSNPDWQTYEFFSSEYDAYMSADMGHQTECFYLKNSLGNLAIGWIHNTKAYWENAFYVKNNVHNYVGCDAPPVDFHWLYDFLPGDYHITWFPTRSTGTTGSIFLDMSSEPLGGTASNHLDTLHADYGFIISPMPIYRSLMLADSVLIGNWDFVVYPNPTSDEVFLRFTDDRPLDISVYDIAGREIAQWHSMKGPLVRLPIAKMSVGIYSIRATSGTCSKARRLIKN